MASPSNFVQVFSNVICIFSGSLSLHIPLKIMKSKTSVCDIKCYYNYYPHHHPTLSYHTEPHIMHTTCLPDSLDSKPDFSNTALANSTTAVLLLNHYSLFNFKAYPYKNVIFTFTIFVA